MTDSETPDSPGTDIPATLGNRVTAAALVMLRWLAKVPLPVLRACGDVLGLLIYFAAPLRRNIALINLRLCFPAMAERDRVQIARDHFRYFTRSFLDRFILWYEPPERIRAIVSVEGEEHIQAAKGQPVILLAPHFVGMDAGGTRLTLDLHAATMFARQKNAVLNEAMCAGRSRFNDAVLISRLTGMRSAVRLIREGVPFYFLPDMDLGPRDAVWVPFFGVPAATVTSVARLAMMTRAKVIPCVTRMTPTGYTMRFYPAWADYPGDDIEKATIRMNEFIEARVLEMVPQYLWSHKRFKTRREGEPDFYASVRGGH